MIIKKLKLKNIRSYEDLEIEFPQGSILLAGDIGSGKTSILLALQFALFGLQPGQKGNSILRNGTDSAYVNLEIEIDNKKIILERTIKKARSGSITQDTNVITLNGKTEEISTSEMKNRVIEILDYPKEFVKKSNLLYKFTVYTPQEEMKEIINERPENRLDTLRHIFGIDRYKRIKENSQIFIQKLKESIKLKEGEISDLGRLKEKLNTETENKIKLSKEVNNLSIENQGLRKNQKLAEDRVNAVQKRIEEKRILDSEILQKKILLQNKKEMSEKIKREIFSLQKQVSEKIDFTEANLKFAIELLEKHKKDLDKLNSESIKNSSAVSVLISKKEDLFSLNQKVNSLENCPTCYQAVSLEYKDRINKKTQFELADLNRELEQKLLEKTQIQRDLEREKELVINYEQDKTKLEHNQIKFEHQKTIETKIKSEAFILERLENEAKVIQNEILELEKRIESFRETDKLFKQNKEELDMIISQVRLKEINLAEKNKELEILKIKLNELNESIFQKELALNQLYYLRNLQDWLQERFLAVITLTEKKVLAKLRSEFSKIFSEWFSILVPEDLSVKLDEDFTPIITNQDYEIEYSFLSGGERTAVALAYRLALNQVLNSLLSKIKTKDIVILDEPTDGFSDQQLDKMRDLFEQLKAEQIILVSHGQKIEGFVDHIIKIRKDGTSSIVK